MSKKNNSHDYTNKGYTNVRLNGIYNNQYISIVEKRCYFCSKSSDHAKIMMMDSKNWGLCYSCIFDFHAVATLDESEESHKVPFDVYYTPRDVVEYLDKYIVGQHQAKKTLAVAAYQNYKIQADKTNKKPIKANVLMLGPTGSGKTALVEHLANFLGVPFHIHDSTQLTETGYHGGDIEDMFEALYVKADNDIEKAQKGIVVLDEIDKIQTKNDGSRDITGLAVQRALLKTLESNQITFSVGGNRSGNPKIVFDTSNVLFIATGAFSGLSEIIQRRVGKDQSGIGFGATVRAPDAKAEFDSLIGKLDTDDLIKYGYIPEFLGRFTSITHTDSISKEIMLRILKEPKNSSLKQVARLLELDGVALDLTEAVKEHIAELAYKHKTGARALRGILADLLKDAMFEYPSNSDILTISVEMIDNKPVVVMKDKDDEEVIPGTNEKKSRKNREGADSEEEEDNDILRTTLSDEEWLDHVFTQQEGEDY